MAPRRPDWWRRLSFEEWLILVVTVGLVGVVGLTMFVGGLDGGAGGSGTSSSPEIEAVIAALDATDTPTATPAPTLTPRSRPAAGAPVPTPEFPTPPAGGLTAAIAPVERAVASFDDVARAPDYGSRELAVGTFDGRRYLGGILFPLTRLPSGSRIDHVAIELAGLSDARLLGGGEWTVEMLAPEAAEAWPDMTFQGLDEAPAAGAGAGARWSIPAAELAPRQVNVLEFSAEARAELAARLEQGSVAFRLRGPESGDGAEDLFIWDTGFGEGFGTRPVLRVNFVPPAPTPGPAPGEPTELPLVVWIGRPTPAPTATPLPDRPPDELTGMILFLSDRFGGDGRVMVYDPEEDRFGQVSRPWVYSVARSRETSRGDRRLIVFDVPCGAGGATIVNEDGDPVPNPDPARRCQQIAVVDGRGGPPAEITEPGWTHYDPAFSPDGEWIVYTSQVTGSDEIFKIRVGGTENTRLTENDWAWDKHPSFSPDGRRIAFWSNRDGRRQLYVMDADGSDQRPLLSGPWEDWDPVWVK